MGEKWYYREWDIEKPKASMLIIHGLGEHSGRYQHVAEWFNTRGISVFSGDLPGFGQSSGIRGHVDSFDEILDMVSEGWRQMVSKHPHVPHFLLGHSLGGLIATYFILERSKEIHIDGAIITSPGYREKFAIPAWKEKLAQILTPLFPRLALPSGLPVTSISRDPEVVRRYKEDPLVHDKVSLRFYQEMRRVMAEVNQKAEELPHELPIYWMAAGCDELVDSRAIKELVDRLSSKPLIRYKEWEGLYHEILNEPEKEEVMDEIDRFIEDVVGGTEEDRPNFLAYGYSQLEQDIQEMMKEFGSVIQMKTIGFSVQNRPVYCFQLGKGNDSIHISGSHHAREWMTSWLCMELLKEYAKLYQDGLELDGINIRDVLDQVSLVFVPMVNPDGVVLATEGWEKAGLTKQEYLEMADRNGIGEQYWLWKANGRGVDLNRQYDMNWDQIRNNPEGPAAMNYKGESPFSEPEVQALAAMIHDSVPLAVVAYHTAGEEIYWYHEQTGDDKERDLELAQKLADLTGYTLIPEEEFVAGGFADWFVAEYKRPGFTVELGKEPHPVDLSWKERIWQQNRLLPIRLINWIRES